ncbi:MAG: type II toxin-antitoxin system YoeB family toxin [Candidatus Methanoplasma sp.]|jgi:Txe/YoeB family toxin of toxin-antitoxin system|nr:type II toxin-antitoxin system YoeB family toxin [Candidatus Methanoplasma sp.]
MELTYCISLSKKASSDLNDLRKSGKGKKAEEILTRLAEDPFSIRYEKLKGEYDGLFSIRINAADRLVYEIEESDDPRYAGVINVHRMRTHCKGIIPLILL